MFSACSTFSACSAIHVRWVVPAAFVTALIYVQGAYPGVPIVHANVNGIHLAAPPETEKCSAAQQTQVRD